MSSDSDSHVPPQAVRSRACRALRERARKPPSQRGMTGVGVARARDLCNGRGVSRKTLRRMVSFFARHAVDKDGATWGEYGKGRQAWDGWGGDPGAAWSRALVRRLDKSSGVPVALVGLALFSVAAKSVMQAVGSLDVNGPGLGRAPVLEGGRLFDAATLAQASDRVTGGDRRVANIHLAIAAWEPQRDEALRGGEADGRSARAFDRDELTAGALHELEHTDQVRTAIEIAMDHLAEDPRYYQRLKGLEKAATGPPMGEGALRAAVNAHRATTGAAGRSGRTAALQRLLMLSPPDLGPPPTPNREEHPYEGTLNWRGLRILVENKAGSTRSGVDPNGKPWSIRMQAHYGEFEGSQGTDGDPLDVYVGPHLDAPVAYVVHQKVPGTNLDDEDKVIVGVDGLDQARALYRAHYNKAGFWGGCTRWPAEELAAAIRAGHVRGKKLDAPSWVRRRLGKASPALGWFGAMLKAVDGADGLGRRQLVRVRGHIRHTPNGPVVVSEHTTREPARPRSASPQLMRGAETRTVPSPASPDALAAAAPLVAPMTALPTRSTTLRGVSAALALSARAQGVAFERAHVEHYQRLVENLLARGAPGWSVAPRQGRTPHGDPVTLAISRADSTVPAPSFDEVRAALESLGFPYRQAVKTEGGWSALFRVPPIKLMEAHLAELGADPVGRVLAPAPRPGDPPVARPEALPTAVRRRVLDERVRRVAEAVHARARVLQPDVLRELVGARPLAKGWEQWQADAQANAQEAQVLLARAVPLLRALPLPPIVLRLIVGPEAEEDISTVSLEARVGDVVETVPMVLTPLARWFTARAPAQALHKWLRKRLSDVLETMGVERWSLGWWACMEDDEGLVRRLADELAHQRVDIQVEARGAEQAPEAQAELVLDKAAPPGSPEHLEQARRWLVEDLQGILGSGVTRAALRDPSTLAYEDIVLNEHLFDRLLSATVRVGDLLGRDWWTDLQERADERLRPQGAPDELRQQLAEQVRGILLALVARCAAASLHPGVEWTADAIPAPVVEAMGAALHRAARYAVALEPRHAGDRSAPG